MKFSDHSTRANVWLDLAMTAAFAICAYGFTFIFMTELVR